MWNNYWGQVTRRLLYAILKPRGRIGKRRLYNYIKTLECKCEPSCPTMGEMCSMVRSAKSGDKTNTVNCYMKQQQDSPNR